MKKTLQEVVVARLAEIGVGPVQAATSAGIERTFVRDIVEGNKLSVRQSGMAKLAAALRWTTGQLTAALDGEEVPEIATPEIISSAAGFVPIRLQGKVEAGSYRSVDDLYEAEEVWINEPRDPDFPNARLGAWDVAGTSMNALKPRPILPNDRVIGVLFEDLNDRVPMRDGMVVLVERLRDGGHLREWSIKQIALFDDRIEFQPRSTDERHKPIVVDRNLHADDGTTVRVLALITRVTNDLPKAWG